MIGLAPAAGSVNPLFGRTGIIFVMGLHHAPIVFIVLIAGLKRIPRSLVEAARIDGSSPWQIARMIVTPLMRPHFASAAFLALVAGFGNFGIAALLGLPVNYLTLPTLIYRRLSSFGPSVIGEVASLGLLAAGIALLGIVASQLAIRNQAPELESEQQLAVFWRLGRFGVCVEVLTWLVITVVLIVPVAALLAAALVPSYGVPLSLATLTADNFVEVLVRQDVTVRAFRNWFPFCRRKRGSPRRAGRPCRLCVEAASTRSWTAGIWVD